MADPVLTPADVTVLKKAIASGALKVRYADGREVTYRSLKEMLEILDRVEDEIAPSSKSRVSFAKFVRD